MNMAINKTKHCQKCPAVFQYVVLQHNTGLEYCQTKLTLSL